ncbi:hypothetical protein L211DRAFT_675248 [Terfezia boudieri ATCC MYA-4762]|uniref:Uncharacterized protein n=1 Tax=Terfezia boudieri ATCC MYA-4762 TaxID=1051890 RepID=A0A3N4LU42_9PEZI|nr:hypothetical protein L211DRAFT_675248 [Terfezia boudieri ATCC MYA-4762]
MSDPSETTTIPDTFYFAAMEQGGGPPESNREAFVRTMTNGPVEQQLVNIVGVLYDVGRKVDKLEVKVDKLEVKVDKLDRNQQEMMNLLRGFITEVRGYNRQV